MHFESVLEAYRSARDVHILFWDFGAYKYIYLLTYLLTYLLKHEERVQLLQSCCPPDPLAYGIHSSLCSIANYVAAKATYIRLLHGKIGFFLGGGGGSALAP